jgi:hypothetical protein
VKIDFEVPNNLIEGIQNEVALKLYLVCDSYLGCDQVFDFMLRVV